MSEFNPYAPPAAEVGEARPAKKSKKKKLSGAITEAIERLNEHLSDASAVAFDRQEAGGKLRTVTVVFIVIALATIGLTAYAAMNIRRSSDEPMVYGVSALAFIFTILAVILVVVDVRMPPRDQPVAPEETLKHFFRAMTLGRFGYAWAALCPTAREQKVETPVLGQIPVEFGSFALRNTTDLKQYTQTFARPGGGQMRTMQIKHAALVREEGDVATVEVTALFQSWPQWAQIASVIALVIIRIVGIILFLVMFFALRKTYQVTFTKTLIRGKNGVWYVYSGDLLEGAGQNS
jgi:hypothetical protein